MKAENMSSSPLSYPSAAISGQVAVARPFAGGWDQHRDRHCIWIVTPDNYVHSHTFDEVALALQGAFSELGGTAPIVTQLNQFAGRAPIIYGANLLPPEILGYLPADSIVVNLEQVSPESTWLNPRYMTILSRLPVLDYSPRNRANLAIKGIPHANVLEIGYHDALTRVPQAKEKDIDVLFYGSMNERRARVLNELVQAGVKVVHLFGVYGRERDVAIGRSKMVINLHHYDSGIFEIVRVSYLLANRVCVLTEGDIEDPDLGPFIGGLAIEPYSRLVERCRALLAAPQEREMLAERGFEIMKSRRQADMLQKAVAADQDA